MGHYWKVRRVGWSQNADDATATTGVVHQILPSSDFASTEIFQHIRYVDARRDIQFVKGSVEQV